MKNKITLLLSCVMVIFTCRIADAQDYWEQQAAKVNCSNYRNTDGSPYTPSLVSEFCNYEVKYTISEAVLSEGWCTYKCVPSNPYLLNKGKCYYEPANSSDVNKGNECAVTPVLSVVKKQKPSDVKECVKENKILLSYCTMDNTSKIQRWDNKESSRWCCIETGIERNN